MAIEYILLICIVVVIICASFFTLLNSLYGSDGLGTIVNNINANLTECCAAPSDNGGADMPPPGDGNGVGGTPSG